MAARASRSVSTFLAGATTFLGWMALHASAAVGHHQGRTTVSHQTGSLPVCPERVARAAILFPSRTTMTDLADPAKPLNSPIIQIDS